MELKELKKQYLECAKKHKLPSFAELNENFEVEKMDKDTDCLLRAVRKVMMEKLVNSLGFIEMMLNPVNAPRIYISYIRTMSAEDRQIIEGIYGKLGELSLQSLNLEIEYDEKKEAELIKRANEVWNAIKPDFKKILGNVKKPGVIIKKEKSYFG